MAARRPTAPRRRPSTSSSSRTPQYSQAKPTSARPGAARPNPKRPDVVQSKAKRAKTGSAQERLAPQSERFASKLNIVYHGKEKTHKISLRLAAVLAFVAVAIFIVATPLNQYLHQQEEKRSALAELNQAKDRVEELEQELALWQDPIYVQSQARERLGYVMPGQTLYSISDSPLGDAEDENLKHTEEVNRLRRESTPFYVTMWDSFSVAGQVGESENPQDAPVLNENE